MGTHYLDTFFNPSSIAVIGASTRPNSVGMRVFYNLAQGGFKGKIYPVNPKHKEIQGQPVYASVQAIPQPIDLAVITTPAATVPQLMADCGEKGIQAVIIISAGFSETGAQGKALENDVLKIAQTYGIRVIGPNCLGLMHPLQQVNATFDKSSALPGQLAFVSQSGAIIAAILDWAIDKKLGFSSVISLGNAADLGFGEILEFLALDAETKSILLYIEGVSQPRRFMNGLRAAARKKPIVVIKAGRYAQGSRAAHTHTGALIGDDEVFDAALRRAGVVRVLTIEQLFSAADIFSRNDRVKGDRLAIITNGGGAGVMAADQASALNIHLPKLEENTLTQLDRILPPAWSHQNPIDILGDATPERYHAALDLCSKDKNIDGLLTILIPVAMTDPLKVAKQVVRDMKECTKPILACWMGSKNVKSSRNYFIKQGLPCFNTPEEAVEAFSYLVNYHQNQELLQQIPSPLSPQIPPDIKAARLIIESALASQRKMLTTTEAKGVLKAFGIPVTETLEAHNLTEALNIAQSLQYPLAMKISSPDLTHKQEAGGVVLNIENAAAVRANFQQIIDNAKRFRPEAQIFGVTLETMYKNKNNRELLIGVIRDKVFGPVITFGAGGSLVELIHDRAIALPPLNAVLAKDLIGRTRITKRLGATSNMQAVKMEALIWVLLRVSEMVCELPELQEMDINPLIINEQEARAVDARMVIEITPPDTTPYAHMAIEPSTKSP